MTVIQINSQFMVKLPVDYTFDFDKLKIFNRNYMKLAYIGLMTDIRPIIY